MGVDGMRSPPGTGEPRRIRYELIGCGLHGHELVGTDAAEIRAEDGLIAHEDAQGLRWYRCLRCDSWLPLLPPTTPQRRFLPPRAEIVLPLRGGALRDRYALRLIALERSLHVLVLGMLAAALLLFAHDRARLDAYWLGILRNVQAGAGGPVHDTSTGVLGELSKLFAVSPTRLVALGALLAVYAALEAVEAVGLWRGRRWAQYLTFVATAVLLVPESYELISRVSTLKIIALLVNLAVVIYLLVAKRLFGLRGGAAAQHRELTADNGWAALERVLPGTPIPDPGPGAAAIVPGGNS